MLNYIISHLLNYSLLLDFSFNGIFCFVCFQELVCDFISDLARGAARRATLRCEKPTVADVLHVVRKEPRYIFRGRELLILKREVDEVSKQGNAMSQDNSVLDSGSAAPKAVEAMQTLTKVFSQPGAALAPGFVGTGIEEPI